EGQMPGPLREHRGTLHCRRDVIGLTQVPLRHDLRLPTHPGDFPQVVVRLAADPLADQACHTLGHTLTRAQTPPPPRANWQLSLRDQPWSVIATRRSSTVNPETPASDHRSVRSSASTAGAGRARAATRRAQAAISLSRSSSGSPPRSRPTAARTT